MAGASSFSSKLQDVKSLGKIHKNERITQIWSIFGDYLNVPNECILW